MIYKQDIEIPSYLCDIDDRLHVWAAVRLCQEVTEYHGNATGIGFKTLLEQNRAWVITRAYYDIKRLPDAFEKIMLSTWSRGNNGLICNRDYRVLDANGDELLTGTSCWVMIDMTSRKVLRLNELIAGYENHPDLATEYATLPRMVMPKLTDDDIRLQRPVSFGMLDHTMHVNNSEYIRMIFDYMHEIGFKTGSPFKFDINYHMESRPGEILTLMHREENGCHWLQINNPRAVSVTAKIF